MPKSPLTAKERVPKNGPRVRISCWFAAIVLLVSQALWALESSPPPGILLITVDTLRADRLGCYRYEGIETPVIDALARDGVLFERAVAQVPLTWPSHAAIFTGTYPFYNGVQDFTGQPLSNALRTLAESLKDKGYTTGAIVSSFVLDRSWGLARGFDFYQDAFAGSAFAQSDLALVDRKAKDSVDQALAWLDGIRSGPFFLWLHLFDPHSSYDPPEPFRSRYPQNPYDGEVAYVDSELGRVIRWLERHDLYENTLIVFVSDHGESLGEHGESEHGFFVYRATVRVPLIVKPPLASELRPRRIVAAVETISIAPTILDLAGVQDPLREQSQASSLVPLMKGDGQTWDRAAYAETFYPFSSFGWSPLRSVQTANYQYIEAPEPELYDLRADPAQKNNLAGHRHDLVESFKEQLQALVRRYQRQLPAQNNAGLSAEALAKLRSLGYVAYRGPTQHSTDMEDLADPKNKLRQFNSILQATVAFRAGHFDAGRSLLKDVEKTDPDLYLIPFLLAQAAVRQRDWATAATEYEKSLKLNPTFDQAMTGVARALHFQGKSVSAKKWLRRALTINPRNITAWYELARVQAGQDPAAALASLEKLLAIQPQFGLAFRDRGLLRIKQKQYAAASGDLEKAVELGVKDPATYNFLGIAHSRTNELALAVKSYEHALAAKPDFAEAHLNLAFAYQRLDKPVAAQQEYETACRLKKSFCQYVPAPPQ